MIEYADAPDPPRAPDNPRRRSGMFDLTFDEVFRNIEQKGRGTVAPFLAVLGPTGSGKSLLLSRIAAYLDGRSSPDAYCHINIDLRNIALADSNQMHFDLIRRVYAQAQNRGLTIPLPNSRDDARSTFVSHVIDMVQSMDKYVMIYVDHSDYVPRYFARSLATQFRDIVEKDDLYPELRRVGLVWSGAMSLFGLKQEVDSAFSMCKTIVTPTQDAAQRELLVRDHLRQSGLVEPTDFMVNTLASQTGGEPAFLDPAIRMLCAEKKGRQSKHLLARVLKQLSDPTRTMIPELKEIALNVHLDRDLREIVERLDENLVVPCREPAVDVDQYHLKGAVVLDKGASRAGYLFRNGLVAQFLKTLFGRSAARQARSTDNDETHVLTFPGPLKEIHALRGLEEALRQCFDLNDATSLVVDAWDSLTECGRPTIAFCLQASKSIWFGQPNGEPVDAAPFPTAGTAAEGALTYRRAFFASDEHRVSVALPLLHDTRSAAVAATVDRGRLKVGLSEMSVHHWAEFVMAFEPHLITLCLSALGVQRIAEMEPAGQEADAQSDPAAAFVHISCFAYDCRGNPIADAVITFERVDGEARTQLGEVRTTGDRARPASIVIPRDMKESSQLEMLGSFAGQQTKKTKLDPANSWSCEFIFHVDDSADAWKSRKRRTGWRCRHRTAQPETRSVPALICIGLREPGRRINSG